ncbi:MAG: BBP7 family outer membrane beta-barrel protein, partial [Planctomycetota bacterium]
MKTRTAKYVLQIVIATVTTATVAVGQSESAKTGNGAYPGYKFGASASKALDLWNLPATNGGGSSAYDKYRTQAPTQTRTDARVASANTIPRPRPVTDPNLTVTAEELERVERVAQAIIENGTAESYKPLEILPVPKDPSTIGPIGTDVPPIQSTAPQVNPHYPQDAVVGGVGPIGPQEVVPAPSCNNCNVGSGTYFDPQVYQPAGVSGGFASRPLPQRTGFFFSWDRLFLVLDSDAGPVGTPQLTQIAPAEGLPDFIVTGIDTDIFDQRPSFAGDRLEFGFCDGCGGTGWLGSVLLFDEVKRAALGGGTINFTDPTGQLLGFADADGDGFDDDLDGDNFFGRDGQDTDLDGIPDLPAAQDDADMTTILPQFTALNASLRTDVNGFELTRIGYAPGGMRIALANATNGRFGAGRLGSGRQGLGGGCSGGGCSSGNCSSVGCSGGNCSGGNCSGTTGIARGGPGARSGGGLRMLYGLRYFELQEIYGLTGTGGFMDVDINSDVENFLFGPQLGLLYNGNRGPFSTNASIRFMPAINFLRATQATSITGVSNGGQNEPLNAITDVNFTGVSSDEQFASLIEWRYGVNYCLTRFLSASVGYTGWWVGGVTRGSTAYNFDLSNPNLTLSESPGRWRRWS